MVVFHSFVHTHTHTHTRARVGYKKSQIHDRRYIYRTLFASQAEEHNQHVRRNMEKMYLYQKIT